MKIIKKALEEPTAEELQIIKDLQSLKHEKVCEIDLMDLVSRFVVKEYDLDQNIAIKLDPDKMTATIYEVSAKNDGKKRATKQVKKKNMGDELFFPNKIKLKKLSPKTFAILSNGELVAVSSFTDAVAKEGLFEEVTRRLKDFFRQQKGLMDHKCC